MSQPHGHLPIQGRIIPVLYSLAEKRRISRMLEFSDAPYRFFEAKPSAPLIRLGRELNRRVILPGKNHRIAEVVVAATPGQLAARRSVTTLKSGGAIWCDEKTNELRNTGHAAIELIVVTMKPRTSVRQTNQD